MAQHNLGNLMKRCNRETYIEEECKKVDDFINDILDVYNKHGLGISHEDTHGAFIIKPIDFHLKKWIESCCFDFREE